MTDFDNSMAITQQGMLKKQNVVDLVIRTLLSSDQHDFTFFGKPVYAVRLVGVLKDLRITPSEATCYIEDHTGRIKAILSTDSEGETDSMVSALKEKTYVEVFASLRFAQSGKFLNIIKIFSIDDANVIVCHLLKFISTRLNHEADYKKRVESAISAGAAAADALNSEAALTSSSSAPTKRSLTEIQTEVLEIIKSEYNNVGISVKNILIQFPAYQGPEIMQAVNILSNEGLIYSTIDQEHFVAVI